MNIPDFAPYEAWDRLRAALLALRFYRTDTNEKGIRIYEPEFQKFIYLAEYHMVMIKVRQDDLAQGLTLATLRGRKARVVIREQLGCEVHIDQWGGCFIFRVKLPGDNLPLAI